LTARDEVHHCRGSGFAGFALLLWWLASTVANAAELRVLCPNALRAPVLEISRDFVRATGHKVEVTFASVGAIHKRIATGDKFDVAIGTAQGVSALVKLGRAVEGGDVALVRSVLALAVLKGRFIEKPTSADALASLLASASSVVMPDAGLAAPGGAQVAELLDRLGLAEEIRARIRRVADPREVGKRVAAGVAEIGISAMADLVGLPELNVVGPLTEPPTSGVVYAVAVITGTSVAEAARIFLTHLRSNAALGVFVRAGYLGAQ
jgi:molybdate transport system substrate-binding protein